MKTKIVYRLGKTTELINMASQGRYKLIVCHSRREADRIFHLALAEGKNIPLPITYEEFVSAQFSGKNIEAFLVDNAEMLITFMAKGVPVEAITISDIE